jgi:hypothetical protein
VHDNARAHYKLLIQKVHSAFEFELYAGSKNSNGFAAVIFFLNDKIEALNINNLYDPDKPFVLVAPNGHTGIKHDDNMYVINMLLPANNILKMLARLLAELQQDVTK